jgi:hypothetical protein
MIIDMEKGDVIKVSEGSRSKGIGKFNINAVNIKTHEI